ncbi:reverse transcriptase family protein [Prosthecobacter sp.]|uniref:reverse transcriptase family protein n=1 Tax=Prosthecobacter sp. TaxID=1965333 RepID=UPI00378441A8
MNPPPFLISFTTPEHFLGALREELRGLHEEEFRRLCEQKLPPVVSIRYLATLFGYSARFLGALHQRSEKYYRTFTIPKGKKRRTINAPKVALKVIQKWFGFYLSEAVKFHDCVYGFVEGRSAIDAAQSHCGANWVYSIDIENFFPSTHLNMVASALLDIGYSQHGADLISKLCCYNGGLAQGSPASPVLSNLVFKSTDTDLVAIARNHNVCYTRYADDLVFSGAGEFPEEIAPIVRSIVESRGWKLAEEKVRLAKRPNRLKVHGLLVHNDKPRLTKGYRNRIRAFKHLLENGRIHEKDRLKVAGHLAYARSVDSSSMVSELTPRVSM